MKTPIPLYAVLVVALAGLAVLSLCVGPVFIPPSRLFGHIASSGNDALALIAREIRLPRTLLAILVGASL